MNPTVTRGHLRRPKAKGTESPKSGDDDLLIDNAAIQVLRIKLLDSISPGELAPAELNHGAHGPTMFLLVQASWKVFRSIADLHSIKRVKF